MVCVKGADRPVSNFGGGLVFSVSLSEYTTAVNKMGRPGGDGPRRIFSLSAEVALKEKLVQNGDTVVITAGVPLGKSGSTNLIKAQVID